MSRDKSKYNLPKRSRNDAGLLWVAALLALAGFAWFFWHAAKPQPRKLPPKKVAATLVQTNPPKPPPRPIVLPAAGFPHPVQTVFEAQLALERHGISSGSLDGRLGSQTRAAIRAYQKQSSLPQTADLDGITKSNLMLNAPPFTNYIISSNDLARLQPLSKTWLGKSQQSTLDYETILELVAEKFHSHPDFVRQLNPSVNWTNVAAGTVVQVPEVEYEDEPSKAAFVRISLSQKNLEAFDADTNLIAHFPCSIAQRVEKRPVGELHVDVFAANPNYTFDPDVFPESPEAREIKMKLVLKPGPNNPVGAVWIGLDKPGYGIHGTPKPEDVGRTESHGCFRLANWNAELLLKMVWVGLPVYVEP